VAGFKHAFSGRQAGESALSSGGREGETGGRYYPPRRLPDCVRQETHFQTTSTLQILPARFLWRFDAWCSRSRRGILVVFPLEGDSQGVASAGAVAAWAILGGSRRRVGARHHVSPLTFRSRSVPVGDTRTMILHWSLRASFVWAI